MGKLKVGRRLLCWVVSVVGKPFLAVMSWFVDGELENREATCKVRQQGCRVIYAFWHETLLVPLWTHRGRGIVIMASMSKDGELVARVAKTLGYMLVRGSDTRNGIQAAEKMVERIKEGCDAAIAVDGPTGKRHKVKKGIIGIAKLSGAAIIPVGVAVDRRWTFEKSWDGFQVAKPGAYVVAKYGEPIKVPAETDGNELRQIRAKLEECLRKLTDRCKECVGEARATKNHRTRYQSEWDA